MKYKYISSNYKFVRTLFKRELCINKTCIIPMRSTTLFSFIHSPQLLTLYLYLWITLEKPSPIYELKCSKQYTKGSFQLNFSFTMPTIDPTKPTTLTRKHTKLNMLRTIHFLLQVATLCCTKYISTGKYMDNGQKIKAPNSPRIWLK